INESVRVYDTSGPWGDPDFHGDVTDGLPPWRTRWIRDRGDVEQYDGRVVQSMDDGFLSERHRTQFTRRGGQTSNGSNGKNGLVERDRRARRPLRASANHPVTQLWYARQGIITPEMEFIAIRENGGQTASLTRPARCQRVESNALRHPHSSESFGANIPAEITPEFVRSEVARGRTIIPAHIYHTD